MGIVVGTTPKMANVLFAKATAEHYPQIISASLHAGITLTNLYTRAVGVSSRGWGASAVIDCPG